jgi:hypothetical protein
MVEGYVSHYGVLGGPGKTGEPGMPRPQIDAETLRREALEWATTRGARSGRVAWQFVQDLAGRCGVKLPEPTSH